MKIEHPSIFYLSMFPNLQNYIVKRFNKIGTFETNYIQYLYNTYYKNSKVTSQYFYNYCK